MYPPNYTFLSIPLVSSKGNSSTVIGGGTGLLKREPFTQLSTSMPQFSSFELSSVTRQLSQSKISFFNIYRPPSSSSFSKPFSLSFCSFFNFYIQHVNFLTHSKNHVFDLVITSADSSLAPSLSSLLCSPSDHFPIFTKLSIKSISIVREK